MRASFGLLLGIVLTLAMSPGCGPDLTEGDLGTVIFEVPKVPGADQPYELPGSNAPAASEKPAASDGPAASDKPGAGESPTSSDTLTPPEEDKSQPPSASQSP